MDKFLPEILRTGVPCDGVLCLVPRKACHEAADALEAKDATIAELVEALEQCNEYFDDLADADQPSGSHPIANREMRLMIDAEAAIKNAKRLLP